MKTKSVCHGLIYLHVNFWQSENANSNFEYKKMQVWGRGKGKRALIINVIFSKRL